MGQSAGAGSAPSGGNNSSGGFGRFNMAAVQPNPGGGFMGRAPQPMPTRAPANANILDPQTLKTQATAMGRAMPATPMGNGPDPSLISTRPGAPMSFSGTAGPRPFMAQPPMYAMSTPNLSAPMYGRQSSPMPSSFASRLSALRGGMFGMPSNAVRFAEGGSTSAPSGGFNGINPAAIKVDSRAFGIGPAAQSLMMDLAREQAPQRQIYQPIYRDYSAPGQPAGLGATPQYAQYQMQMPTFTRPRGGDTRLERPVPAGGMFKKAPATDPNLAIINQALGPQKTQYDTDGNPYNAPVYMDQSQRDAILANPGAYLEYARYVQGGNDPSKYVRQPQPISMMSKTQQDALIKKQKNELNRLLPPARVDDSGGG